MSTIVDAAIVYPITYIPTGARKPRSAHVVEHVPIEVKEIDLPPLAGRMDGHEWRFDGERLWIDWSSRFGGWPRLEQVLVALEARENPLNPWAVVGNRPVDAVSAVDGPNLLNIREVVSTRRQEAIAELNRQAANLALSGDKILVESAGPLLKFKNTHQDPRNLHVVIDDCRKGRVSSFIAPAISMHDVANVVALLSPLGFKFPVPPEAEMFIPEAFPTSVSKDSMLAVADQFLFSAMPNRCLSNVTARHLEAYLQFTDPAFDRDDHAAVADVLRLAVSDRSEANFDNKTGQVVRSLYNQVRVALQVDEFEKERLVADAAPTPRP